MAIVKVKISKQIKVTVKIHRAVDTPCPLITVINGGSPGSVYGGVNGLLNGGTP